MRARREAWFEMPPDLHPARPVFLDATGATTKMAQPPGQRAAGPWKTTTRAAGLRLTGMAAPMVIDGAMNGEAFTAYAETGLAPALQARRHRHHGHPARPQGHRRPRRH